MKAWLDSVREALDNLSGSVDFFFRDDDAGWGNRQLFELLDIFGDFAMPIDLAAIPMALDACAARDLRRRITSTPNLIHVHQHGFSHVSHEIAGRKCEFGPARDYQSQRGDIERGWRRLGDLLGPAIERIFTPPWNRCSAVTGQCLVELGFKVLSRDATAGRLEIPGLEEIPIHQDWFAHRKGVRLTLDEWAELLAEKIRQQKRIGIMFHHAVMNDDEWRAATEFLSILAGHTRVHCYPLRSVTSSELCETSLP